MTLNVNFKLSGAGNSFALDVEPSLTVLALKTLLMESAKVEPEKMKLIFKGRILKDTETLESSKVESGQTMHIVKAAGAAPAAPAAPAEGATSGATSEVAAPAGMGMAGAGAVATNPMAAM